MRVIRILGCAGVAAMLGLGAARDAAAQAGRTALSREADDPALRAHIDYLIQRLDAKNRIIRRSVRQALVAVGKPALPALESVAARGQGAGAETAARIIKAIQNRVNRQAAKGARATGEARARKQHRRRGRGLTQEGLAKILEEAGVDPGMAGEIRRLLDEHRKAIRALRQDPANKDEGVVRARRRALSRAYREKLEALLGPEQAKAFMKAMARRRAARGQGGAGKKRRPNRFDRAAGGEKPARTRG